MQGYLRECGRCIKICKDSCSCKVCQGFINSWEDTSLEANVLIQKSYAFPDLVLDFGAMTIPAHYSTLSLMAKVLYFPIRQAQT